MTQEVNVIQKTFDTLEEKGTGCCLGIARFFDFEELAAGSMMELDNTSDLQEGEAILTMRKEARQLIKSIRLASMYLLFLTGIYLVQSVLCLVLIDKEDFQYMFTNSAYADQVYDFSVTIEKMKVVHAMTLSAIAIFVLLLTYRFAILNERHYI
jgi:hypothetical protein